MEKFKGTQGEWNVEYDRETCLHYIWQDNSTEKHYEIPTLIARTCYAPLSKENAQLIAAAPELLEALQNTLSALKAFIGTETSKEWIEVQQAEVAINKALGIKE